MQTTRWMKVGELAEQTGVTVRTLHHYDDIGLLKPAHRTEAGYRMYGPKEVLRLSQIVCLRQLGFGLEEIQATLSTAQTSLADTLARHAQQLQAQIQQKQVLLMRLQTMAQQLRGNDEPSAETLGQLMEAIKMLEKYYTPEQMEQLSQRHEEVGDARIQEVQREWEALFARFQDAHDKGLDPGCDEVQALVQQSNALIQEFTGGDQGITRSLNKMYQQEGAGQVLQPHGYDLDPAVFAYMDAARAASTS